MISVSNIKKNIIDALEDIKAFDIVSLDVRKLTSIADYMIIASASSSRQTKALANNVQDRMKEINVGVVGMEGESEGGWVLVDVGDVVVHIMTPTTRAYYNLEELWSKA
ncbi:ribosome silencing factor [Methylophilaceae bacterium]|nr:ribosome silencing factor [Methylophilaceae bacterium]